MSDTTFIKQCEKAEEIQALKPKTIKRSDYGDWSYITNYEDWEDCYISEDGEVSLFCPDCNSKYGGNGLSAKVVWLPTQAQLQEMLKWEERGSFGMVLIDAFYQFAKSNWDTRPFNTNNGVTWESLWLAFVMKEKYGKVWDGDNWIKGD